MFKGIVPPLTNRVMTFTQRVPPSTVVDRPPTARSVGAALEPKFHVPFFAFPGRPAPPEYITSVAAAL